MVARYLRRFATDDVLQLSSEPTPQPVAAQPSTDTHAPSCATADHAAPSPPNHELHATDSAAAQTSPSSGDTCDSYLASPSIWALELSPRLRTSEGYASQAMEREAATGGP